jgi:hypothetical protein
VDLIYIDPPFNSNRNYEVFWGETKEKRAFEDRHENTKAFLQGQGRDDRRAAMRTRPRMVAAPLLFVPASQIVLAFFFRNSFALHFLCLNRSNNTLAKAVRAFDNTYRFDILKFH